MEGELSESLISQENTLATREVERESHVAVLEAELKQAAADKMKLQHRLQEALDKEGTIQSVLTNCKEQRPRCAYNSSSSQIACVF